MSGWFAVKRGITSHPLFSGRPERLAIWLWLLDNAAWKETKHDIKGKTVMVPRGSVCASERRIAEEVGVGRQVVRTFLARLKDEHMINPDPTHGRNIISLCNWEKYQSANDGANPRPNPRLTQDQPTKEQGNNIPVGAGAPPDPAKVMFDAGVSLLIEAGKSEGQARSLIGKWRKDHGVEAVIAALGKAKREGAVEPVSFIEGCFKFQRKAGPQVGEVREVNGCREVFRGGGDGWVREFA